MQKLLVALSVAAFLFVLPMSVSAAGLVPCGGATERPCQTCDVVVLTNNVVSWLVMILGTIAAILIVVAGVRLVTSGGNMSAKEQAKSSMTNLIVGYLIVLSAWLVLDYGLKALLVQDGAKSFGVWNEVSCVDQPIAGYKDFKQEKVVYIPLDPSLGNLPGWVFGGTTAGGSSSGGSPAASGSFNAACRLLPGPPGVSEYDCSAQQAQCKTAGGSPTINTARSAVICTPSQASGGGGGSGTCAVVTNPANACYPSKLTCFPDRNLASEICNVESRGGNTQIMSGTDLCSDGRSFSVGLWQINILTNRQLIPGCNSNFFTSDNNGKSEGSCIQYKTNSGGIRYCQFRSCRITNVGVYNQCIANARLPVNNTNAACGLMRTQGWGAWSTSYNKCR